MECPRGRQTRSLALGARIGAPIGVPPWGREALLSTAQHHMVGDLVDSRHEDHAQFSGTVGLPLDFRFSTVASLGSGYPFDTNDCSKGYDKCVENIGGGSPPKWTESIDLRLEKNLSLGGSMNVGVFIEAINVFNYTNEQYYDGCQPALPEVNAHYARTDHAYNPRRLRWGAHFSFGSFEFDRRRRPPSLPLGGTLVSHAGSPRSFLGA